MLSKKYYRTLASFLKNSSNLEDFSEKLISFCKSDNGRFSETRFREAMKK